MVFSSKYLQGEDNNISLPPVRGKCKIQDIFVLREKNKALAYLVLQHREFCCPDGDQEPPGCFWAQVRVGTDGWDVFRQMRREKRMPQHKDCLSEHARTDELMPSIANLSLSGK